MLESVRVNIELTPMEVLVGVIVLGFLIWVLVEILFARYFKRKQEYQRRFLENIEDETQEKK